MGRTIIRGMNHTAFVRELLINSMETKLVKRFLFITDLEGAWGVESLEQILEGGSRKDEGRANLTRDVNAAIRGLLEYEETSNEEFEIHVWDGHGGGGIVEEELIHDQRVRYYPPRGLDITRFLKEKEIDALLFIGQHAMSNTREATLCHTFSIRLVDYYRLRGTREGTRIEEFIGEFGYTAALAAEDGVQTIFLSGDDKAVSEAQGAVDGIETVVTKEGVSWEEARFPPGDGVRDEISSGVQRALRRWSNDEIGWFRTDPPLTLEIANLKLIGTAINVSRGARWKGGKRSVFVASSFHELELLRRGRMPLKNPVKNLLRTLNMMYRKRRSR